MRRLVSLTATLALSASSLAASSDIVDLRAARWKRTYVANVGTGVVQYMGDDAKYGSFATLVEKSIRPVLRGAESLRIELKTADVRLSLPDTKVDEAAVNAARNAVPAGAAFAPAIAALFSAFSKNKMALAVFCVSIDGKNFLGNDARLFRYGAQEELDASIEAALKVLSNAIQTGSETESPACEPGWEGGQEASP